MPVKTDVMKMAAENEFVEKIEKALEKHVTNEELEYWEFMASWANAQLKISSCFTEIEKRLLDIIESSENPMTKKVIAEKSQMSPETIDYPLFLLRAKGCLKHLIMKTGFINIENDHVSPVKYDAWVSTKWARFHETQLERFSSRSQL